MVLIAAAAVLAVVAVRMERAEPVSSRSAEPATTATATTATTSPPPTIPPVGGGVLTTTAPARRAPVTPRTTTTTTLARSPLASRLGDAVSVTPRRPLERVTPARIIIDSIGVDHPVRPVGVETDGQLEIPDESEVGWYRLGSAPGQPGAAVFAGHVSWNGSDGPFLALAELEPGGIVRIGLADGTARVYEVVERAQYPKLTLPADRIWTMTGPETLVLITCGGEFDWDVHRYYDNVVVYARPVT